MAQVHRVENKRGELADLLGMSLGQGIGNMVNDYFANKTIEGVMNDKSLENAPFEKRMGVLQQKLSPFGERGNKFLEQRIKIEEEGRKLRADEAKKVENDKFNQNLKGYLKDIGMSEEEANVVASANPGVQTAMVNNFLGNQARKEKVQNRINPNIEETNEFPAQHFPPGMNDKEKVDFRNRLRTENVPIFNDSVNKSKGLKHENMLISRGQYLNEKKTLPEGLEKLLIDPETGDFYGAAKIANIPNADAQSFYKTIQEFTSNAQATYGGKVTNFELNQYLRRLPGLLNSFEGRKNIFKQMEISNKITDLYEKELQKIYRHYRLDGITQEEASAMAEERIADEEAKLMEEFRTIDEANQNIASEQKTKNFNELPNPAEFTNKILVNPETGERMRSNGKTWEKV